MRRTALLVLGLLLVAGCGGGGGAAPSVGSRIDTGTTIDTVVRDIPLVTSLTPSTGPQAGGTVVTLTGKNLGVNPAGMNQAHIQVGSVYADDAKIEWIDDTHIRFVTPAIPDSEVGPGATTYPARIRVLNGYTQTVVYPGDSGILLLDAQPKFIYTVP